MMDVDQKKACECDRNAVVSAGAGSGKTRVLASRYVRLITEGKAGVENILTLTFTNKAAAEMWTRIYSMLLEKRDNPLAAKAINEFDRARISTIDSFCAAVARNWAERFGIPQDFVQDNTASEERLRTIGLSFMMKHCENRALKEFIKTNRFENVLENFFVSLGNEYFHIAKKTDFTGIIDRQMRVLADSGLKAAKALDETSLSILALDGGFKALEDAKAALKRSEKAVPLFETADYEAIESSLAGIQLGKRTGAGNSESILLYKELAEQWTAGKETLLNCCASLLAEPAVRELARLSKEFEHEVHEEKRKTGILSFKDVSEMAVVTLTENLCLRRYYKNTFRYIMIDEFQDNNALQKNLLFLIAEKADRELPRVPSPEDIEGDKLFFVGDEKQSIYRFRGADVSVFNRLKRDIGGPGGESAALHTNYRSEPALIDFFNTVFQSVMRDAEKPYEASFVPLKSREENPGVQPVVRILYHPYTREKEPGYLPGDEAEAHAIASFVKRAVEEGGLRVSEGSGTRRARYEDIAILLRSTGNQIIYERVLRQKGIPYNAVDVRTLFLEAPVADIYNILQIAVHPEDRAAYAGYLRSPFVGLGDQAFADILSAGTAAFAEPPSCAEAITPFERTRYKKGEELYRDIELRSRTETITELLFHLWYRCGYRYTILRERRFEGYLEYYDYLIKIASSYDKEAKPLPEFLDFLRKNMGKYERLSDTSILKEEARGVQIMTIHKAKGLEFPIVICANAGNSGRKGSELSAPYYVSDEYDISFNLIKSRATGKRINYFYQLGKEENEAKALAEVKRLLYVTLTRAENHILISGCHTQNNRSEKATFLNMVLKALGWDGETSPLETESLKAYIEEIPDITREESFALIEREQALDISALAAVYEGARLLGHSFFKTDYSATELCAAGTEPSKAEIRELPPLPSDEKGSEGSDAAFGTLCHYIIEKRLCGIYDSDLIPDSIRRFFSEDDYFLFKSDAEILAGHFIESPYGREAMADASRRMEFPFQSRYGTEDEPAYVSGKIDLLYRKDGGIVVIDFKSSRSIVAHEYDVQLSAYRKAVQDIWGLPVRTLLFYLRSGEAVEVNADADIEQLLVKMRRSHD